MNPPPRRFLDEVLNLYGARAADVVTSVLNNERVILGVQRIMVASLEFRDFLQRSVAAALEQLKLPNREDVERLHELLLSVDQRLDDISRRLDALDTPENPRSTGRGAGRRKEGEGRA